MKKHFLTFILTIIINAAFTCFGLKIKKQTFFLLIFNFLPFFLFSQIHEFNDKLKSSIPKEFVDKPDLEDYRPADPLISRSEIKETLPIGTDSLKDVVVTLVKERYASSITFYRSKNNEADSTLRRYLESLDLSKHFSSAKPSKEQFELDSAYFNLYLYTQKLLVINDRIRLSLGKLDSAVNNTVYGNINREKLDSLKKILQTNIKEYQRERDIFRDRWQKLKSREASLLKDHNTEKPFGAIPSLTSILGKRETIPNISLLGDNTFNRKTVYGTVKLFAGIITDTPTDTTSKVEGIFIPDASEFGITTTFSKVIPADKWLRQFSNLLISKKNKKAINNDPNKETKTFLNLEYSYLGKKIKQDSIKYTVGTMHFRLGFQQLLVKNIISVYANYNVLLFTDNVNDLEDRFQLKRDLIQFVDFGLKFYLNASEQNDLKILLDLGFINTGGDAQNFLKTKDLLIPNIKIGLRKNFDF